MLYGMALLFGATGCVALVGARDRARRVRSLPLGCGLFLIGIAFKLSLVPFHVWTPDVYEGAPLPVTAFMSVVTKAGMLAVFARFAYAALPHRTATALLGPDLDRRRALDDRRQCRRARANRHEAAARVLRHRAARLHRGRAGRTRRRSACATRSSISRAYTFMNLGAFAVVALLSREHEEGSSASAHSRVWATAIRGWRRAMTFFLLALAGLAADRRLHRERS